MAGPLTDSAALKNAAAALLDGRVVVAATDTLIGLLVDPLNEEALETLRQVKARPDRMPVALIAPSREMAEAWAELGSHGQQLADAHWPGPLTLVARPRRPLPDALMMHGKVGVRVPAACAASEVARLAGSCVTATSANLHGEPAPTSTDRLSKALRLAVEQSGGVVLEGSGPGGAPSTLVDVESRHIIRAGAVDVG